MVHVGREVTVGYVEEVTKGKQLDKSKRMYKNRGEAGIRLGRTRDTQGDIE